MSDQVEVLRRLRQPVAAALLGVGARALRDSTAPRNPDGTYDGVALVAWHFARLKERYLKERGSERWLAVLREEKARLARRRNAEEEGRLVDAGALRQCLEEAGKALRAELEALERAHGPEVGRTVAEALDRAEAAWRKRLAPVPAPAPAEGGHEA